MTATKILVRLLAENAAVTSLTDGRVYGVQRPQGSALPAVVVTCVYEDQDIVLNGHRRGYVARMEVSCVGASVAEADELAEAVKDALEIANVEIMSDESPASVEARVNYVVKDGADVSDYSDDRTVFRRIADYRMRWSR